VYSEILYVYIKEVIFRFVQMFIYVDNCSNGQISLKERAISLKNHLRIKTAFNLLDLLF